MPRQSTEHAYGPYQHGNRWRVVIAGVDGQRIFARDGASGSSSFESYEAAHEYIENFRAATDTRTIDKAMTAYLAHLAREQIKNSVDTARHRLLGIMRPVLDDRLVSLTPAVARRLQVERAKDVAPETVRGNLGVASQFAQWCVAKGWLGLDPFKGLAPPKQIGGRPRGKPQLRVDEARRLITALNADPSPEATAVLMTVLMGLRAHEVVERTVRDLDDGGRLLWISKSKTKAGVRQIAVPPQIQPRLIALAAGKKPDERIFTFSRYALHYHVVKLAKLAGVPRVTPHGLRGTFATLAVTAQLPGMSPAVQHPPTMEQVAKSIGHNDRGATMRRHYMAPGAEESAASKRVGELLGTAPTTSADENTAPKENGPAEWN